MLNPKISSRKSKSQSAVNPISTPAVSRFFTAPELQEVALSPQAKPTFAGLSHELKSPLSARYTIQPKLTIVPVGDKYEQEADLVAQQVVQQINLPSLSNQESKPTFRGLSYELEAPPSAGHTVQPKAKLQCKGEQGGIAAPTELESSIQRLRGQGQPLSKEIREPMEQAFGGVDFKGVSIHTDAQANQLNQSIQSKAFTTGQDVFFRQGAYEPGSQAGRELLAHELTHVLQQTAQVEMNSQPTPKGPDAIQNPKEGKDQHEESKVRAESVQASHQLFIQRYPVYLLTLNKNIETDEISTQVLISLASQHREILEKTSPNAPIYSPILNAYSLISHVINMRKASMAEAEEAEEGLTIKEVASHRWTLSNPVNIVNFNDVIGTISGDITGLVQQAITGYNAHHHHGTEFQNRWNEIQNSNKLPVKRFYYWKEYVIPTNGVNPPGPQRLVVGEDWKTSGNIYYTGDHYGTFHKLQKEVTHRTHILFDD